MTTKTLRDLTTLTDGTARPPRTRQLSAENPTGERNRGATAIPDTQNSDLPHSYLAASLGQGFKVRPFVRVAAGERLLLGEISGAGVITNLFITSNITDLRDLQLRIWWDGLPEPAVDVSLASFFCLGGPGQSHAVSSIPITVGPVRGCSSSWEMPFSDGARIVIENRGLDDADVVAYKVTYEEKDALDCPDVRFHARTVSGEPQLPSFEFDLLETGGEGWVVGTSVNWRALGPRWWGEGEVKVYFGDDAFPTLVDTGTEDYFGGAWGFGRDTTFLPGGPVGEQTYSGLYAGVPFLESNEGYEREISLYRWHIADPIGFEDGIRMAVQVIGIGDDGRYEPRRDLLTATGYWYARPGERTGAEK